MDDDNSYTACWALWPKPDEDIWAIPKGIDRSLSGYLFYPEIEWAKFGYRPPESQTLMGAWRNPEGTVFVFLLDQENLKQKSDQRHCILYVAGNKSEINVVVDIVNNFKDRFIRSEKRDLSFETAKKKLEDESKAKYIERLLKIIGLFAAIVNAFSLYIRTLSPPAEFGLYAKVIYNLMIYAIHFSALVLLFIVTLIAIVYAVRYGLLISKRF
ncbi:MAG: hypothetical protein HZA14_10495 [Nitrospirae bacterium]|nr:hypothetical protein [Nitrospirota bacterium]